VCNCPDGLKGNACKHQMFVMTRVLGLPSRSELIHQQGLLASEEAAIINHGATQAPRGARTLGRAYPVNNAAPVNDSDRVNHTTLVNGRPVKPN